MRKITVLIMISMLAALCVYALPAPKTQRNYMLVFELTDYSNQLKESVSYFFDKVFQKGDMLIIATPTRLIGFSPKKLAVPKNKLVTSILKTLKEDIAMGSSRQRTILQEMQNIVLDTDNSNIERYKQLRKDLAMMRDTYEPKLMKYAQIFRKARGNNNLLMFLQQEFRPIPDKETMNRLRSDPRGTGFKAAEAYVQESYKTKFDPHKIKVVFNQARVRFHFLYLKSKRIRSRRGVDYVDNMGDLYSDFSKLAKITDGIKMTSAKPASFVKMIRRVLIEGKVETEVVDQKME
jgi:hypothetical protein